MSGNVLVLAEQSDGQVSDATYELLGKGRELATAWGGTLEVATFGPTDVSGQLGIADAVVRVDHPALASYTADAYEQVLLQLLTERAPRLLLLSNDTVGLDLGTALAVSWDASQVAYVMALAVDGDTPVATAQILGGKILAEVEITAPRGICTVIGGSFPLAAGKGDGTPEIVTAAAPGGLDAPRISLRAIVEPDTSDVDITAADLLVSAGRGVGSKDDLEVVQELADALGAPLSASRPVIDAGWMPKTRQVGKSGLKVKPKAYLSFGISGAPEHLEGMRDAELIIACNTDANAPIFDVAHYGTTVDLFDLVPAIVEEIGG
ncbi:MAG: electron transfer flavoprotein subunit alpha/FixB family protein [Actinobacteria bacterium]|nr:electron transfer flavoprotein subunit alpha/FixB family protein [Actinomycetota bacterium]